ncbi:heterokaryon incompatibility protein-domain-containing protein [Aspergillus ambiguus]|uniref:HET domain-containing protein n=1 Tax=Aspergillus ambiguus TaxID=176160 RepID=UPI003CCD8934
MPCRGQRIFISSTATMTLQFCVHCHALLDRIKAIESKTYVAPPGPVVNEESQKCLSRHPFFKTTEEFEGSEYFRKYLGDDSSLHHKTSRTGLSDSARAGCKLCQWLLNSLDSRQPGAPGRRALVATSEKGYRRRPLTVQRDKSESRLGRRCGNHYLVELLCPSAAASEQRGVSLRNITRGSTTFHLISQSWYEEERATLIIDPLTPELHNVLTRSHLDAHTPSDATWALFQQWVDTCTTSHPECRQQKASREPDTLPTRLLDIQTPDAVRVVSFPRNAAGIRYATLSHCWGNVHEPQLNSASRDTLERGWAVGGLPCMYRDAIVIARRLHIPYIWIDSLCIIQDSTEDWQAESAKMGYIYKNSFLCIAAAAAADNGSELLHMKELEHSRPLVHDNLVICEDIAMPDPNLSMSKLVQCDRLRTLVDWCVERAPLNQRGWVFQERIHAPRIIHCTTDEYVWECCRGITTESHPTWTKGSGVAKDTWAQIRNMEALSKEWPSAAVKTKKTLALLERWSEVITTYSGLGLSRVDDKLVACSAIATSMQPFLGDYVEGLWKEYLPSQLLWYHDTMCGVRREEKHHLRERRRPSWSWASLDCRVRLPFYYDGSYDREYISQMSRSMDRLIDLQASPLIKILDVDVGSATGACIRLMGRLFPIYRSIPFGYLLDTKAPDMEAILNHTRFVTWEWDDRDSRALSESEKAVLDAALQPSKHQW